jgi:hypothetical protein
VQRERAMSEHAARNRALVLAVLTGVFLNAGGYRPHSLAD